MSPLQFGNYQIKRVPCGDVPRVVDYFLRFYFTDEPLSKYLRLTESAAAVAFLRRFCAAMLRENVSVMAVAPDGQIAAVSLNSVLRKGQSHDFDVDPKVLKIATFVTGTIDGARVFEVYPDVNEAMYVGFMSVHPEHRNRGLAKCLLEQTRLMALDLGLKVMRMDCCSLYTAKAAQRFGWTCLNEVKYVDYVIDGVQVFKPEAPHTSLGIYGTRIDKPAVMKSSM